MGSALHYTQHLAINLENQAILLPHPKRPWRVILYREGTFVRGGRFCTPLPAVPGTTPTFRPSQDISTLQRRIHPPERVETPATRSLKHRRRVIWYREGVFVRGGRFCALSQAVPGTTQTVPPSRDISTLQRRIHPPE